MESRAMRNHYNPKAFAYVTLSVADMDDVELLVERQRARDVDDAVGRRARRVGRERRAGAGDAGRGGSSRTKRRAKR